MNEGQESEEFASHDKALREEALSAFRSHHRTRKMVRAIALVVGVVALGVVSSRFRPSDAPFLAHTPIAVEPKRATPSPLSDEELLKLFPQGTCWIAEVDGRKVLMFADEKIEREFLVN
jgi:hypothetical protein